MSIRAILLTTIAACAVFPAAAAENKRPGSLYPPTVEQVASTDLAKSLGPSAYILSGAVDEAMFQALVRQAVARHPIFHAQASQRSLVRSEVKAARSALYPRLSATLNGDYVIAREFGTGTENIVDSLKPGGQVNAGLSASQLIFDGGATFARIKSAKARGRETEQSLYMKVNELSLAAVSTYHDLVVHQAILALGEEFIRRHEGLLNDVKERERLGAGTRADVLRASARLSAAKARVSQVRESARFAEIRYTEFFDETARLLARPSFESLAVSSRDEAVALAVERNPEIGAAIARVEIAASDFKAVKATRLPEVRATVSAVQFDILDTAEDYDVRAGVSVNYDLYAGGARSAEIARAREMARQGTLEQQQVRGEIEREAAIAYERQKTSQDRLVNLEEALIAQYKARDLVAERYRAARGDLIDVLQSENDWFEAGVAYLAGAADRDMAIYEMMEFTGDLLRFFSPQDEFNGKDAVNG